MFKFLFTLIFLCSLGYGVYWVADSHPEIKDRAIQYLPTSAFSALEPRFTVNQIMDKERSSLLKDSREQFGDYSLLYQPFLLMEVKFTRTNQSTGEGVILWDLMDGEMVLDTQTWEKSHGFADCIHMRADPYELKIISTIAKHGNKADRQTLFHSLNLESGLLDAWIERCIKKKLIVCHQGIYRIHLESPKMAFTPSTQVNFPLISKNSKHSEKMTRNFSKTQIIRVAEAAFGEDFAIRQTYEIYLPVYAITTQNSDGSHETSYWNALNGLVLD
ncbi:hypothetical protein [Simkania negevensis]|uniref:Uncharacterized protein n=1 Tax=Simkania negevensis (strain ATCC VR-1471 / DSM 27360 / Z) TaxID=331113 RepID=F8L5Q2_SIMNZ|nr:hypothetical protein [Simkania negevensis]MCB1075050.1 hypothetical protein [Simkania sp.]CCB88044.1 putative uncharacterized protein [Simkania negevensis Z]